MGRRIRRVHILHGFNVTDGGAGSIDKLAPYLPGFLWTEHDYGYFELLKVRFCNGHVAESVKATVSKGDVGIGHSNGCAILAEAALRGAPFEGLVFINPALDEDCVVAQQVKWVHVYFNAGDYAVWSAKLMRFRHPWGAMGRVGFKGNDPRYRNFDCGPQVQGHSDIFTKLDLWGPRILQNIKRALG